jgi:hypothetical protein
MTTSLGVTGGLKRTPHKAWLGKSNQDLFGLSGQFVKKIMNGTLMRNARLTPIWSKPSINSHSRLLFVLHPIY